MLFCLGCWTQNLYLVRRKGEDLTSFHLQKFITRKWVWIIKYCDLTERLLCLRVTLPLSWYNWIKFCSKYFHYTRGKCFNNIEKPCFFCVFILCFGFLLTRQKGLWKQKEGNLMEIVYFLFLKSLNLRALRVVLAN